MTLTVRQALALTTGHQQPPWRVNEWRSILKVNQPSPLSVRKIIVGLEQQKCVFFLQARGSSLLKTASNLDQIRSNWKTALGPTKRDLQVLASELSANGISIIFISADRRIIGISGVIGLFGGVNVYPLDAASGIAHIAEGVGLAGGAILSFALAAIPEPGEPVFAVAAALLGSASGALIGVGLAELFPGQPVQPVQPVPQQNVGVQVSPDGTMTFPALIIRGPVPQGVDPDNVFDLPPIAIGDFPEDPPPDGPDDPDDPGGDADA
jgi:hypothetical protein